MENKVRILEFELTGADGGTKAEIRLNKCFHDTATEFLGSGYLKAEQELVDALTNVSTQFSRRIDHLMKSKWVRDHEK